MLPYVLAAAALCVLVYIFRSGTLPPGAPPSARCGVPWLGPAMAYGKDAFAFMCQQRKELGNVFCVDLVVMKAVIVTGAEGMRKVFKASDEELSFEEGVGDFAISILGKNPFKAGFHLESSMAGIKAALRPNQLDYYCMLAAARTDAVVRDFLTRTTDNDSRGALVDLARLSDELMSLVMAETFLGTEFCDKNGKEYTDALRDLEYYGTTPEATIFPQFPSAAIRKCRRAREVMARLTESEFEKNMERARTGQLENSVDFLSLWFSPVVAHERSEMLLEHFKANLIMMTLAARTNIMGSFTWTAAHLLKHGEHLRRVEGEAMDWCREAASRGLLDHKGSSLDTRCKGMSEMVQSKMKYTDLCMKEAARLNAPLSHQRKCVGHIEIEGYVIPRGHYVMLSPMVTHHDATLFAQPEEFRPERFQDGGERAFGYAYSQFGYGKHKCLGNIFSTSVIRTVYGRMFGHYEFVLDNPNDPLPRPDFTKVNGTAPPLAPIWVRIKKRK